MKKILVADGDEAICLLYSLELAEEGYEVITNGEPDRLLEVIDREKPDLVLIDCQVGKGRNKRLIEEIKDSFHGLPVIVVSTYAPSQLGLVADDFVLKSSDLREMKRKIRRALGLGVWPSEESRLDVTGTETISGEQMGFWWRNEKLS